MSQNILSLIYTMMFLNSMHSDEYFVL